MGRFIVAVIIAATVIVAVAANRTSESAWQVLAPGLEYRVLRITNRGDHSDTFAHLLRVDLQRAKLSVLDADVTGHRRATVDQFAEATKALAVINGGFFDKQGKSLGLVISDGTEKSRWLKREWGIFLIDRGRARIVHANDYRPSKDITQAVEVGPRLVVKGRIPKLKEQTARRSAIGIQRDGRVIILASESSLSLQQLAMTFATKKNQGGLGCVDALHLDGGQSSQLYVRLKTPLHLKSGTPVANAIGIFASKPDPSIKK